MFIHWGWTLEFHNYETHLGSHNNRAKGVLGRRATMIWGFRIQYWFRGDLDWVWSINENGPIWKKNNEVYTDGDLHSNFEIYESPLLIRERDTDMYFVGRIMPEYVPCTTPWWFSSFSTGLAILACRCPSVINVSRGILRNLWKWLGIKWYNSNGAILVLKSSLQEYGVYLP